LQRERKKGKEKRRSGPVCVQTLALEKRKARKEEEKDFPL